jgi:hypothetical protein
MTHARESNNALFFTLGYEERHAWIERGWREFVNVNSFIFRVGTHDDAPAAFVARAV